MHKSKNRRTPRRGRPVKHKSVRLKLKGAAIDEVGLFDAAMTSIELRPEEVQDVRTLGAAAEELINK